jgi:hypothetical protein
MLLFDRVLENVMNGRENLALHPNLWPYNNSDTLLHAIPIKIDNIMEAVEGGINYLDAPKPISPFTSSFLDCYARIRNGGPKIARIGIHVLCHKIADEHSNMAMNLFGTMGEYFMGFTFFDQLGKSFIITSPQIICLLNKDGNLMDDTITFAKLKGVEYHQIRLDFHEWLFNICLFSFSLMNCKNIIVHKEDAPQAEQVRRIKEIGMPLVTYRVIKVSQILIKKDSQERLLDNESCRALHICRGNFATYDEEKPLFGKYSGTFWRPQHFREDKNFGRIIKEYHV